jgi:hypothetical protein
MFRTLACAMLLLNTLCATAQTPPALEWSRNYGGSLQETGNDIVQTTDGGFIFCASTTSNNGDVSGALGISDIWVVKLDADGNIQWQRVLGGSSLDNPSKIMQLPTGGYLVLATTRSNDGDVSGNHGDADIWLAWLSAEGALLDQRCYGGSLLDSATDLVHTPDGGYIISGLSRSSNGDLTTNAGFDDLWVLKVDGTGEIQWQHAYGGSSGELAYGVALTSDGGVVLNGITQSTDGDVVGGTGSTDYWVLKLDPDGNLQWQRTFGGSGIDNGYSIIELPDGTILALGADDVSNDEASNPLGDGDFWTVQLTSTGDLISEHSYGGSSKDIGRGLLNTTEGGRVMTGSTFSSDGDVVSNNGGSDAWVLRTDEDGDLYWTLALGGSGNEGFSRELARTADGGYILIGSSSSSNGDLPGNQGDFDVWVVKLGPDAVGMAEARTQPTLTRYPNPCTDLLHVVNPSPTGASLPWRITDAQGRTVLTGTLSGSLGHVPVATLATGPYTVGLEWNGQWVTAPFVKE